MGKGIEKMNSLSRRSFVKKAAVLSTFYIVPRFVLGGKGYTPPSDKITLGFIGAGRRAIELQKNFLSLPDAKIIAACDVYEDKVNYLVKQVNTYYAAQAQQSGYNGTSAYSNFMEMLERKDIDAVVISTPDHWHASMAVRAAKAGKDIYGEKPLSLSVSEGRAMVDMAEKYKRVFQTGSMQRSMPEFRHAVELIRNGYLGQLQSIKVNIGNPPIPFNLPREPVPEGLDWNAWLGPNQYVPYNHQLNPVLGDPLWAKWRDFKGLGGGDLTDWGAHLLDIVQWALDMDKSGPVEVIPPNGKNVTSLTYRYNNGITVTKEDFGKRRAIQFIGSDGKLEVKRGELVTSDSSLKNKVIGENEKHVYNSSNHFQDFLKAIKQRSKPVSDIETGHRSATVCNIGNIAFELNRPLKWDPKKEKFENDDEANKLLSRPMKKEWAV